MKRHLRARGRKRPVNAEGILSQVREEFSRKRDELGSAQAAADAIDVSVKSFYNYLHCKTVPDLKVLMKAAQEWEIVWRDVDLTEIMRRQNIKTAEQLSFHFLESVREEDVEVVRVDREGSNLLKLNLKIHF